MKSGWAGDDMGDVNVSNKMQQAVCLAVLSVVLENKVHCLSVYPPVPSIDEQI